MLMAKLSLRREISTTRKLRFTTNPFFSLIIHFKVEGLEKDEDFKVDWKQVERTVKEKFGKLKLIYSRADPHEGDLAFSQLRIKMDLIKELTDSKLTI